MKMIRSISLMIAAAIFLYGCPTQSTTDTEEKPQEVAETAMSSDAVMEKDGLKLSPVTDSPVYADAGLELEAMDVNKDPAKINFNFNVTNYELGAQTADAAEKGLANSGKGQHIHFIVNNGPYSAHYEPQFEKEMEEGHYVILAFLSRSYHESVKNATSYFIDQVTIGEGEHEEADLTAPHMFYSRPKGVYKGADTDKLLLDFFLLNCDLSVDGYHVRATINGTEFMLTKWQPYMVEGLPKGEVTVKLELLDAEGNAVPGPFNVVERTVTLAEAEGDA